MSKLDLNERLMSCNTYCVTQEANCDTHFFNNELLNEKRILVQTGKDSTVLSQSINYACIIYGCLM